MAPSLIVKTQLAKGMSIQVKSCTTVISKAWGSLLQLRRHITSWTLGSCSRFRSRISHDTIPWTILPKALLLLTLVSLIQCSFIKEKYLPPVHHKLVFQPLDQHLLLAVCLLYMILESSPQISGISQKQVSLVPRLRSHYIKVYLRSLSKEVWSPVACHIHFCSQGIMNLGLCRPGSHSTFRAGVQLAPPAVRELGDSQWMLDY